MKGFLSMGMAYGLEPPLPVSVGLRPLSNKALTRLGRQYSAFNCCPLCTLRALLRGDGKALGERKPKKPARKAMKALPAEVHRGEEAGQPVGNSGSCSWSQRRLQGASTSTSLSAVSARLAEGLCLPQRDAIGAENWAWHVAQNQRQRNGLQLARGSIWSWSKSKPLHMGFQNAPGQHRLEPRVPRAPPRVGRKE